MTSVKLASVMAIAAILIAISSAYIWQYTQPPIDNSPSDDPPASVSDFGMEQILRGQYASDEKLHEVPAVATRLGIKQGTITEVVDGDTVDISASRYRLNLIDTPERGELGFLEATNEVKRLCPRGSVVYYDDNDVTPFDKYGRHLGVIWCEGNDYRMTVGEHLYSLGLAEFYYPYCGTSEAATDGWAAVHGVFYREMCAGGG